ncbi:Major facilitator superfamily domain, general substrate transporter [Purpureocillium lavendulum]|uniref:2'-phosphotransferase n=1 Tax=Purpureocillium lavendulum TaxID=1247861 RepID=A0AB34G6K3_9HYPO|nr:Major facilitator superfamily domain, general substrate transporter [Purpureocillium lavendulum]
MLTAHTQMRITGVLSRISNRPPAKLPWKAAVRQARIDTRGPSHQRRKQISPPFSPKARQPHPHQHLQPGDAAFTPKTTTAMADHPVEDQAARGMEHLDLEDKVRGRSGGRAAQGRRGGGRGGKGGGGGSGGQGRDVQVSRALSRLLRHQAANAGIKLDGEGFAPLDQVLAWGPLKSLNVTLADVQSIVATNEKQRFALKPNPATNPSLATTAATSAAEWLIRANQGHSIKLESSSLLEPVTLDNDDGGGGGGATAGVPARVLHGTYFAFWPAIEASGGLRPMGRNHVHCSAGVPGEDDGVVSGMRGDAELLIELDVAASLRAGVKWWRSDNGVLLTEGDDDGVLSTRFFKRVTGRKVDVGVLWEDGEKKADLPPGIKGRVPQGKGPRGSGGGGGGGRGGRGGRGGPQRGS